MIRSKQNRIVHGRFLISHNLYHETGFRFRGSYIGANMQRSAANREPRRIRALMLTERVVWIRQFSVRSQAALHFADHASRWIGIPRPATKKAWRLRALLQIALAYLLAINGVLAGFGAGAGGAIVRNCRCRSFFVAEGCHWTRPLAALAFWTAIGLGGCLEWEKAEATMIPLQEV